MRGAASVMFIDDNIFDCIYDRYEHVCRFHKNIEIKDKDHSSTIIPLIMIHHTGVFIFNNYFDDDLIPTHVIDAVRSLLNLDTSQINYIAFKNKDNSSSDKACIVYDSIYQKVWAFKDVFDYINDRFIYDCPEFSDERINELYEAISQTHKDNKSYKASKLHMKVCTI